MANTDAQFMEQLLNGPALMPPAGVVPNFVDPPNLNKAINVSGIILMTFTTIGVVIRVYTKAALVRKFSLSDYLVVLSYCLWIVYFTFCLLSVKEGSGVHQWNVQFRMLIENLKWTYRNLLLYCFAISAVKTSILVQYIEVFVVHRRRNFVYWASHAMIWINNLFYLSLVLFIIFGCNPREKAWRPYLPGKCFNTSLEIVVGGAINVTIDFAIFFIPHHAIWKLNMPRSKKIGVSIVFAFGLLACCSSIARLYYSVLLMRSSDLTYYWTVAGIWTWVELCVGLSCICITSFPVYFRALSERSSFPARICSQISDTWHSVTTSRKSSTTYSEPIHYPARPTAHFEKVVSKEDTTYLQTPYTQ